MSKPLTPEEEAVLRVEHQWCGPCDVARLLATLDAERTEPARLREALEAIDVGMYPASGRGGKRTDWQDGWNAGVVAMSAALDAALAGQEAEHD